MKDSNTKNYVCIFPGLLNYHLIKDVGLLPYTMGKFFNYNVSIVTYKNDDYHYLHNELEEDYLKLVFLEKKFKNEARDVRFYLFKNSKNIDVLQFFYLHYTLDLFINLLLYKLLNRKGNVYVKLDADYVVASYLIKNKGLYGILQDLMVKYLIDCISVETYELYKELGNSNRLDSNKLIYLPNGISIETNIKSEKKNYILTVGRLGTEQKATEILLEAFSKINDLKDWKLILVGSVEESFKKYLDNYFQVNPHLKEKVVFTGNILDRETIYEYYSKSKIFCFPSRWESFGLVLTEAAYFGDYILATDIGATRDVLEVTNYGEIIRMNDSDYLALRLQELILNWNKYEKDPDEIMEIVKREFEWKNICKKLDKKLNSM